MSLFKLHGDSNSPTHNELNKDGKHNELHAEKLAVSGNTQRHLFHTGDKHFLHLTGPSILFSFYLESDLPCGCFPKNLSNILCSFDFSPEYLVITAIIITYRISNFLTLLFLLVQIPKILNGIRFLLPYFIDFKTHSFPFLNLGRIFKFAHLI